MNISVREWQIIINFHRLFLQDGLHEGAAISELQKRLEISGLLSNPEPIIDEIEDKELIQLASTVGSEEAVSNMQVSNISYVLVDFCNFGACIAQFTYPMVFEGCASTPRPLEEVFTTIYNFEGA